MNQHHYGGYLDRVSYETDSGSEETRRRAAERHLPEVLEVIKQVGEDRLGLAADHRELRESWEVPAKPDEEPHFDHTMAARTASWRIGALVMFLIEATFASWLATTYLAKAVLTSLGSWRLPFVVAVGALLTLAGSVLFFKAINGLDDDRRPRPSVWRLGRIAAVFSVVGLVAMASFLTTRQYAIGGPVLQFALAVLTLALAGGVAASVHIALILHRPNRVAKLYDTADKLYGRAEIIRRRLEGLGQPPTPSAPVPAATAASSVAAWGAR